MTERQKWDYIASLDEEFLLGCAMVSEKTAFIVRDADVAFCAGANLATVALCQAAMESHLRYEYGKGVAGSRRGFHSLIEDAPIPPELKDELHALRRFRNAWLHMDDPHDDGDLFKYPEKHEEALEEAARGAVRSLRKVLYIEQGV